MLMRINLLKHLIKASFVLQFGNFRNLEISVIWNRRGTGDSKIKEVILYNGKIRQTRKNNGK